MKTGHSNVGPIDKTAVAVHSQDRVGLENGTRQLGALCLKDVLMLFLE